MSSRKVSVTPILLYLCHRRQDLVAVAASTEGVTNVISPSSELQGWSEDWYISPERPPRYRPPSVALWHARMDRAPLSVDWSQAGYKPSVYAASIGDRRRIPEIRTRITTDWWPIYVEGANGLPDALAKAKSRWVDPIYSAGRAMNLEEWAAYTGYRMVKPLWFDPVPLPWAGLSAVGSVRTIAWRQLPIPTSAPYDAAIRATVGFDSEIAPDSRP